MTSADSSVRRRAAFVGLLGASLILNAAAAPSLAERVATPRSERPAFKREVVDEHLPGAAFGVVADLIGSKAPELVVSGFGIREGSVNPSGTVVAYRRAASGAWSRSTIVPKRAGILFPNEVLVDDVDGDGDADVIVPGGFFICALSVSNCGSLTWWEQRPGGRWRRHTLVPSGAPGFYHRVILRDLDGDGRRDLLTVAETAATAQVEVFAGTSGRDRFAKQPVVLALGGGSLPILYDADGDGDEDIVSGQYFDRTASFVWFERTAPPSSLARFGVWVRHVMAVGLGGVIQTGFVPGLGLVGSNHTNTTSGPPGTAESGVYLLRPQADPRLPWRTTRLSDGMVSRSDTAAGQQQGAPGVFGHGDVDGDGDTDLVVSGDGDPRLFWLERIGKRRFATRVVAEGFGQAGGAAVLDADRDRVSEVFFTSYDENSVNLFTLR